MGNCALVAAKECLQSPPAFFTHPLKLPFSASQHPSASLEEEIISAIAAIFSLQCRVQCAFPSRL